MAKWESKGVFKGMKVLDFTIALAGVYTAWQFADLGAEVWKVERYNAGDQSRTWDPFVNGMSTLYCAYNKNKQSIELDLSSAEGKNVIYEMVKQCDVVLENFKSGSIDRLGLGYDKLKEINPGIVFMSLSGFGASGPLMKYPCYDAIAAARGGFAASNGEAEGAPVKAGNANCDTLTGIYGFNAVLMALIEARRTGKGCRIDIGMSDVVMEACAETVMDYGMEGKAQARFGNHDRFAAPYGIFEARDGWVSIVADTQEKWKALANTLGLADLLSDPRFATMEARIANREVLTERIEAVTRTMFRKEAEEKLLAVNVGASEVLPFIEAYTSDHANQTDVTALAWQDNIGFIRFYNNPIRFNDELCPIHRGSPLLGQDSRDILERAGYSREEIQKLIDDGVVGEHMF
ncbi:CaiB/BaiF CoA transferase family protein [Lacrimispora saccharolytica]|uniref:L-carnitine dehydratase/bile acid-inducible protein F n=1 Tax=Lacrimispora saccharolytica (strain ATCC 35040 / DSM 2544 / NRCC 2533 / WM1) TaxID=610130 RepID=D9R1C5_LACSW|nr:CaiB/BaiF CoA-transferase family protein [Lacrimispora saccharolytica]ADL06448.1 L-carnitine dehydratase/bile acid-inducible protein F [[Clostridium] saccharolyticum WM1]QRV19468.1 CoA transferase [Lacrimispora saccharolytica]